MRATNRLLSQRLVPWCFVTVLLSMDTVDVKQWSPRRVQRQNITAFKRHWLRDQFCRNLVRLLKLWSGVTPAQPEPWQTEWVWGEPNMSMSNTCGYNKLLQHHLARVAPVSSNENLSDIGTKRVPGDRLQELCRNIGLSFAENRHQ